MGTRYTSLDCEVIQPTGMVFLPKYSHTYDMYCRPAGVFAKVNRIVFTQQGNKFGVCDGDGNTALWQVNSRDGGQR